jgi:hypothetical protein
MVKFIGGLRRKPETSEAEFYHSSTIRIPQ